MRNRPLAWAAAAVLASLAGPGTAMADVAPGQSVAQTAASEQAANAGAASTQVQPTNENISVRVLSSGDDGAVTQSNTSAAEAAAANANATLQAAGQSAPAGGPQAVAQQAQNAQAADAGATSTQIQPTNRNISVRVLSDGDDGDVSQENASSAAALAANANKTAQIAAQNGGGGGGGGTQAVAQKAASEQDAASHADSVQKEPSNVNVPVRVLSKGDVGDVDQANTSAAKSAALNANETVQKAAQDQGTSAPVEEHPAPCRTCAPKPASHAAPVCECAPKPAPKPATAAQVIGQKAENDQSADAGAVSKQIGAKNVNAPVRVKSEGDDGGAVDQRNDSFAGSLAANANLTGQVARQAQGGTAPGTVGIQAIGQVAKSAQDADADATSLQAGAKNVNAPVRVLSGGGGGGDVTQRNASFAGALALNLNATKQLAAQDLGGGSGPLAIQAIGQAAFNHQSANADATSQQLWPANVNTPVDLGHAKPYAPVEPRDEVPYDHPKPGGPYDAPAPERHAPVLIWHPKGGGGSVQQANDSAALAAGLNGNWTGQLAFQG